MACDADSLARNKLSPKRKVLLFGVVVLLLVTTGVLLVLALAVKDNKAHDQDTTTVNAGDGEEGITSNPPISSIPSLQPHAQSLTPSTTSSPVTPSSTPSQYLLSNSPTQHSEQTQTTTSPSIQPSDVTEASIEVPTVAPTSTRQSEPMSTATPSDSQTPMPTAPLTPFPTTIPSMIPSESSSYLESPTQSVLPSISVLSDPTQSPTGVPGTAQPSLSVASLHTVFYVVADAPYNVREAVGLAEQVSSLPHDAEFLVHLGDIKHGQRSCVVSRLRQVDEILRQSPVPVFLVVGDNEYNDCRDPESALGDWKNMFGQYDRHWNHTLNVIRPDYGRTDSFYFVSKRTLFIGLNLVGGDVHNNTEWRDRLTFSASWTISLIEEHARNGDANNVIIFGHAEPGDNHRMFFNPLRSYIQDELGNGIPILYMNGDVHSWFHQDNFFGQQNFLRLRLTGGVSDPPLKMVIDPNKADNGVRDTFRYERFWY